MPACQRALTACVTTGCAARAPATIDRSGAVRKVPVEDPTAAATAAASVLPSSTNHCTLAVTPGWSAAAIAFASAWASVLLA